MTFFEFVVAIAVNLLSSVVYDASKNTNQLKAKLNNSIRVAEKKFFQKYGNRYGSNTEGFTSMKKVWEIIEEKSLNPYEDLLVPESIMDAYEGNIPVTREALEFFIETLHEEIKKDNELGVIYSQKLRLLKEELRARRLDNNMSEALERLESIDKDLRQLTRTEFAGSGRLNNYPNNIFSMVHDVVVHTFIKKKFESIDVCESLFFEYSSLFREVIKVSNSHEEYKIEGNVFEEVTNLIFKCNNPYPLKVHGTAGTGKSTFLSLLYLYLYSSSKKDFYKNYFPYYMNLHFYESQVYHDDDTSYIEQAQKMIDKHLEKLIILNSMFPSLELIIIIDGTDDYFRSELLCDEYVKAKLQSIKNKKKIIGVGKQSSGQKKRKRKFSPLSSDDWMHCLNFEPISVYDESDIKNFINAYARIERDDSIVGYIHEKINDYSMIEIDLNIISLLVSKRGSNFSERPIVNLSSYFYDYCYRFLGEEDKLLEASNLAYRYAMTDEHFTESNIIKSKAWALIHKHKSFCNYLLAYNIINKLSSKDAVEVFNPEEFNGVYPKEVNFFMKDLLNEDFDTEQQIYDTIVRIYKNCSTNGKTHLCYLLGRMSNESIKEASIKFLIQEKRNIAELEKLADLEIENNEIREKFLLHRTIYISLVYLGKEEYAKEYIELLIKNPELNSLNRGFHLGYYGDIDYVPGQEKLIQKDNVKKSFNRTFKILHSKIKSCLENNIPNPLFEIDVFTLCSLAQYRQIANKLPRYKGVKIKEIIDKIISDGYDVCERLGTYIFVMSENLKSSSYNSATIMDDISRTKLVEREGWKEAEIEDPESIAEHMYNCVWIGLLYLPETPSAELKEKGYEKKKILDMLFIHDIGEVYVGDMTPKKFDPEHQEKENRWVKYIFMHGTYPEIQNLDYYNQLWAEFYERNSINAAIARDIDKIEAIFQFYTYKNSGFRFRPEKEKEWVNEKHKINTEMGKKILNILIKDHFSDQ